MSSPFASLMYFVCTLGAVLSLCGMWLTGTTDADVFTAFAGTALVFLGGLLTVVLSLVFTEN